MGLFFRFRDPKRWGLPRSTRPAATCPAISTVGASDWQRRRTFGGAALRGLLFVVGSLLSACALVACGGASPATARPATSNGGATTIATTTTRGGSPSAIAPAPSGPRGSAASTQLSAKGKLTGPITVGGLSCSSGGEGVSVYGNVGRQPIAFEVRGTKSGQHYDFPQPSRRNPAVVTFVMATASSTIWTAGSVDSPGKGTLDVTETTGIIDVELGPAANGPEHVSGYWQCG